MSNPDIATKVDDDFTNATGQQSEAASYALFADTFGASPAAHHTDTPPTKAGTGDTAASNSSTNSKSPLDKVLASTETGAHQTSANTIDKVCFTEKNASKTGLADTYCRDSNGTWKIVGDSSHGQNNLPLPSPDNGLPGSGSDSDLGDTIIPALYMPQQEAFASPESPDYVPVDVTNAGGIEQTYAPDCFFEAPLASLAQSPHGIEQMKNMIKKNNDDSYTVTFPGDKDHPVTLTAADMSKYQVADQGESAKIIEAAFIKYDHLTEAVGKSEAPSSAPLKTASEALSLLTDFPTDQTSWNSDMAAHAPETFEHQFDRWNSDDARKYLAENIQEALQDGIPIVATSNAVPHSMRSKPDDVSDPGNKYPIFGDHEYSVLGFNSTTNTITVRNPWGTNVGTPISDTINYPEVKGNPTMNGITNLGNGELSMSLDTFTKYFSDITMGMPPARPINTADLPSSL